MLSYILYICATILICTIIIAVILSINNKKMVVAINNIKLIYQNNHLQNYPVVEKQDNSFNPYEDNINNSLLEIQYRAFEKPVATTLNVETSAQEDDINELTNQLKSMKND